ncbi:MAG: type II secretion system F family protein [Sulfuricellaceae bacterium]
MTTFSYKAVDDSGKIQTGRVDAANTDDLEQRLSRIGLYLISSNAASEKSSLLPKSKVRRQDLITFCFHMEQLSKAGVPLLEGLSDLRDSIEHPRFKEIVAGLIEQIEGGATFSTALESYPDVFEPIFVSLISAGEQTGQLPEIFKKLTDTLKWQDELAAQTKKLLMYPAFVGTVIGGVVFFLMIYLVPQLVGFIKNMGGELPFHTKALIVVSGIFVNYWYLILSAPVILFVGVKIMLRSSAKFRFRMDGWKLTMWLIGPVLRKIILARFASLFAMMYSAGITILDSIKISESVAGNLVIADGLHRVGAQIAEGQGFTTSFQNVGLFPPLVIRMLRVGETTGALDTAMLNVSYFYDREVKESIERVQAMIEPIMTVTMGLILGWVMLSVMGPIYDTISKIKT